MMSYQVAAREQMRDSFVALQCCVTAEAFHEGVALPGAIFAHNGGNVSGCFPQHASEFVQITALSQHKGHENYVVVANIAGKCFL